MLGATLGAKAYLDRVCQEIQNLDLSQVQNLSDLIERAYDAGRFVFIIGNGGSGANASHLCEDLAKCTLRDFENQKRLKVLSLTDNTPGIMAWANDEGYDRVFVEQLKQFADQTKGFVREELQTMLTTLASAAPVAQTPDVT